MTEIGTRKSQTSCQALTKNGHPCKNRALADSDYCRVHHQQGAEETQLQDVAKIMRELTR